MCLCLHKPFDLLIFTFMHNPLILGRFFDFLREKDLLASYMVNLVHSKDHTPSFIAILFSEFDPTDWISSAFLWSDDPSIDWRFVNDLWNARLDNLKNNKSSK